MHLPSSQIDSNFNQLDSQEKTQLTSGGVPSAGEFNAGDIVGDTYEVLALIGSGGMGHVYRVRHTLMDKQYALKTLSAEQVNESAWRRFQNEAQAIARMNHPNVVGIYNLGLHDGRLPFYVMDLLAGRTLNEVLHSSGTMPLHETLKIFSEVASGVGYAHKKGIVHRDIKPPNIILLDTAGPGSSRVRIVDFGIAKLSGIKDRANQGLTSVGELCGSPYYMSPEQCEGGRVDARADIYSFGCTLFEALTGSPPFKGRNAIETMCMHQSATPPTLKAATGKNFPPMLEMAVATMLAKTAMDRYQNMELIIQDFNTILEGKNEAISPYIGQRQGSLAGEKDMPGQSGNGTSTGQGSGYDQDEADDGRPREHQGKRPLKTAQTAASVSVALIAAVALVWVAGGLYSFLTPRAQSRSITHFGNGDSPASDQAAGTKRPNATSAEPGYHMVPAPADQSAGKSIDDKQPYSSKVVKNGEPMLCFDFPSDFCLGELRTMPRDTHHRTPGQNRRAQGQVLFKASERILFVPDPAVAKYPQYLQRFRDGDIYKVLIAPPGDSMEMMAAVANIKGVKRLEITIPEKLDDSCITEISKMTSLEELELYDANISSEALARLPFLKRLKQLTFTGGRSTDILCKAMLGSTAIKKLFLEDAPISAEGFKALSTLTSLDELQIDGTRVNDSDLLELSKLPHLKKLIAVHCQINQSQIGILEKFPTLETLQLDSPNDDTLAKYSIRKRLDKVKVL